MDSFLETAILEARQAHREGGIPIGSVIVHNGKIIGRGHNRRVQQGSAILHGEMDAIENAGRQPASVYWESVLYTPMSPSAQRRVTISRIIPKKGRTRISDERRLTRKIHEG
jgi:creatinine deaminase